MPPRFVDPTDPSAPLVWRVPSWQPTVIMLFVCGSLPSTYTASPSTLMRVATIGVGAVAFVSAIEGLRMYLVVDQDGIGFRGLFRTHNVEWPDVSAITVRRSGFSGATLRITRADGSYADVPPSLVLPTKPTGTGQGARATRGHRSHDHRLWAGPTSLGRTRKTLSTAVAGAAADALCLDVAPDNVDRDD